MEKILQLTIAFLKIGFFSIGGGYAIIPLIEAQVVDEFGWISQQTFTDMITISQMTPGPLAVNTSTFVGFQIAGAFGAVLATIGCVFSGVCLSFFLYCFFKKHRQSDYIFEVIRGLKATSFGFILSAAGTILLLAFTKKQETSLDWIAVVMFAAAFFVLRKWKVNPILILLVAGILGGILY